MRELTGDLFSYPADAVCIPVNWRTKRNGDAVMGAGVAKQAAERWPELPGFLGRVIRHHELAVHAIRSDDGPYLVMFPTKQDWREPSSTALIERMVTQLVWFTTEYGWRTVVLPRLGCGHGGLDWSDVRPVLERHLDSRFVVLAPEAIS